MDPTPEGAEPRRRRPSPRTATPRARHGLLPAMVPVLLTAMLWTLGGTRAWAATPVPFGPQANAEDTAPPEGVAVYRCLGAKGGIEFRDDPCPPGTQGESLVVEDHATGWAPTPAPPTAATRRTSIGQKAKAGTKAGHGKGKGSAHSARERQEESCRKKREQVEELDRKLRLGATARKSTELRHRRRVYEDYLYTHCD
ncbi:MAG TPA: DUF4124 domain-containing protein [Chromatiaceae bacterium]|nr:DUF4124 domain-containing protein [Chromatiaceae bacterium]